MELLPAVNTIIDEKLHEGMSTIHCMFCGGAECKYENWRLWTNDPAHPNAIDGLFSNW